MHLVSCTPPQAPLDPAPRTALLADRIDGEQWDGFWSADVYYARCTKSTGEVGWYRLEDDAAATPRVRDARVLSMHASRDRVTVIVAQSPGGRRMLVGSARRSRR